MAQGVISFKYEEEYEEEKRDTGMTGLAGLPVYLDLASVMGTNESIERLMHIKQQSWTDRQTLLSLILTNLAGGDCVDDLRKLSFLFTCQTCPISLSLKMRLKYKSQTAENIEIEMDCG